MRSIRPHSSLCSSPILSNITGPFFLAMAGVSLLFGLGLVALGKNGWNLIGIWTVIGAIVLCCVPELLLGKYRNAKAHVEQSSAVRRIK